jgi:hypothetical protein
MASAAGPPQIGLLSSTEGRCARRFFAAPSAVRMGSSLSRLNSLYLTGGTLRNIVRWFLPRAVAQQLSCAGERRSSTPGLTRFVNSTKSSIRGESMTRQPDRFSFLLRSPPQGVSNSPSIASKLSPCPARTVRKEGFENGRFKTSRPI